MKISYLLFLLPLSLGANSLCAQSGEAWILIDTQLLRLSVLEGDKVKRSYENISIGRGGATFDKRRLDRKTPYGDFHIVRISKDTPFHRFFAFDYPAQIHADRALQRRLISQRQYAAIRQAFKARKIPPQDTPLGGYIGIHGVGAGDAGIHTNFNWTNGCIALTNEQIDDLAQWIRLGMRVIVR